MFIYLAPVFIIFLVPSVNCGFIYVLPHDNTTLNKNLAPVVQRPDNFIQWISYYPIVSICSKTSVFPR